MAAGVNILPYALVNSSNFATTGGTGIIANATFATTLAGATSTTNVILTDAAANTTLAANTSVGSLILIGNVVLTINPGFTLTLGNAQTTGGLALLHDANGNPTLIGGGTSRSARPKASSKPGHPSPRRSIPTPPAAPASPSAAPAR